MAYTIKYSNGRVLALLADQSADSISTSLTLVGKNSNAYGESINNNFVHLLENFAKRTAPPSPLSGQLWYDTAQGQLKVYSNNLWKPVGSPVISATQPSTLIGGEFWFDTSAQKLWYYNGVSLVDLAKPYSDFDGKTGAIVETVVESSTNTLRPIINFYTNGVLIGWASDIEIPLNIASNPLHISSTSTIRKGFTLASTISGTKFYGTATSADSLSGFSADQVFKKYLTTSSDYQMEYTYGSVEIYNPEGLGIGPGLVTGGTGTVFRIYSPSNDTILLNTDAGAKTFIQYTTQTGVTQTQKNAIMIDSVNNGLGLFTATVASNKVEIHRDVDIYGDLNVKGSTNYIEVDVIRANGKQILIGTGQPATDSGINGSGILIDNPGSTNHYLLYQGTIASGRWTTNDGLKVGADIYLGDNKVLGADGALGNAVLYAPYLRTIGSPGISGLDLLTIGDISWSDSTHAASQLILTTGTIKSTGPLYIEPGSLGGYNKYISFNNSGLFNVAEPNLGYITDQNDVENKRAVNKRYVDNALASALGDYGRKTHALSMDVTGFTNVNASVKNYLDILLPVDGGDVKYYAQPPGTRAAVLCSTYVASSATFILDLSENKIPYSYTVTSTNTVTSITTSFNTATTIVTDVAGLVTVTGPLPTCNYTSKLFQVISNDGSINVTETAQYVIHTGTSLVIDSTAGIGAGAVISGNGYSQGQIVTEILSTNTLVTSYGPNGIPSNAGVITFTMVPGFKGWVYIKDL
jgi:hypothetical protein